MTITDRIRMAIADRKARKARDEQLAAIQSRIHTQRLAHGSTKHLHEKAYKLTHEALRRG